MAAVAARVEVALDLIVILAASQKGDRNVYSTLDMPFLMGQCESAWGTVKNLLMVVAG